MSLIRVDHDAYLRIHDSLTTVITALENDTRGALAAADAHLATWSEATISRQAQQVARDQLGARLDATVREVSAVARAVSAIRDAALDAEARVVALVD